MDGQVDEWAVQASKQIKWIRWIAINTQVYCHCQFKCCTLPTAIAHIFSDLSSQLIESKQLQQQQQWREKNKTEEKEQMICFNSYNNDNLASHYLLHTAYTSEYWGYAINRRNLRSLSLPRQWENIKTFQWFSARDSCMCTVYTRVCEHLLNSPKKKFIYSSCYMFYTTKRWINQRCSTHYTAMEWSAHVFAYIFVYISVGDGSAQKSIPTSSNEWRLGRWIKAKSSRNESKMISSEPLDRRRRRKINWAFWLKY